MMFSYVGLLSTYLNWMPTYAIKSGALQQTSANLLISIFWIVELAAKVVLLFLGGTISSRIYLLLNLMLVSGFVLIILQWFQFYTFVCYFGIVTAGFFSSAIYALFFTVAQSYGYELNQSATANMTIFSVLAEGMVVTPIGYLIGHFGFQAFIYSLFVISTAMLVIFAYTDRLMEQNSKEKKPFLQIQS